MADKDWQPMTAILGVISTLLVWLVIIVTQSFSRWVGLIWMALGIILYIIYRFSQKLPLFSLPEKVIASGYREKQTKK